MFRKSIAAGKAGQSDSTGNRNPSTTSKNEKCISCNHYFKKYGCQQRLRVESPEDAEQLQLILQKPVAVSDQLCDKCRKLVYKKGYQRTRLPVM